jgi:DegV family protein with EDD domain
MHIVTDRGVDLTPRQMEGLDIHFVPLTINLDDKSYRSGVDIQPAEFYELLESTDSLPTTSQPAAGDFAQVYRELAASDPEILSIHISAGLSGTVNAATAGAAQVPEANITIVDTKTLSGGAGWQVEAAARAAKAGWAKERILALMSRIAEAAETVYTLSDLTYLIHGGRISHMRGLIASVLNIKPIIGVEKQGGTYAQMGQTRTFKRAVKELVNLATRKHEPGSQLRVQIMHANNPEGVGLLREAFSQAFECTWLPVGHIAPVLGAHSGPTMVGAAYASCAEFPELP